MRRCLPAMLSISLLALTAAPPLAAQNRGNVEKIRKEHLKLFKEIGGGALVLNEVAKLEYDPKKQEMDEYVRMVHLEAGKTYDVDFLVDQTWNSDLILRLIYSPGDIDAQTRVVKNTDGTLEAREETTWFSDFKIKVNRTGNYPVKVWGGPGRYFKDGQYYTKKSGFIGVIIVEMDK